MTAYSPFDRAINTKYLSEKHNTDKFSIIFSKLLSYIPLSPDFLCFGPLVAFMVIGVSKPSGEGGR